MLTKQQLSLVILSLAPSSLSAFVPISSTTSTRTALGVASQDIIAKAREKIGLPAEEAPPKLFEDDLLAEMQQALLKLDRRAKEGPLALTMLEVEELNGELSRILNEMKVNHDKKPPRPARKEQPESAAPAVQHQAPSGTLLHADPEAIESLRAPSGSSQAIDTSEDEGPMYDGRGGMGQPKGTVNTYVIPGMDEMSAEEYRDALQRSVSERQARRRASGIVGNKSSHDYLSSL